MPWEPDAETTLAIRSESHLKVRFIQQSPLTIENIALAVGYDSHSAFSQAFRQYFHKTPSEYRQ